MSSNNISSTLNNIFRIVSGQQRQEDNGEQPQDVPVEPSQSSDSAVHPAQSPQGHPSTPMDVDPPHFVRRPRRATQDHGDDEDDGMPPLQDVSESDESGDENFSATDSDMDADIPPQTDSEQLASDLNSDAPSGAATPSRGSRRARGEHDDDEDRDRRHPSQRIVRDIPQSVDNPTLPPNAAPPPAPPRRAGIPNGFQLLGLSIDLPGGQFRPIPVLNGHAAPDMPLPMPDAIFVNDLFTRLGGMMGGLGIPEREDPERAKQLVGALEEVPVGLIRRLERISAVGGADDNGTLGDSGCAICWDKLLDGDGSGFGDRGNMEENVAGSGEQSLPPTSESAPIESETSADHPKIVALPCAHIFHASCLIPWFSRPRQTTCPTCRFNIDPENLTGRRRLPRSVPNANAPQPPAPSEATAQPQQLHDGAHPPDDAGAHPELPQDYGRMLFERVLQSIGERMTSRGGQQAATPDPPPPTTQPVTGAGVPPGQGSSQPSLNVPSEPHVHVNHGFDGGMIIDMVSFLDEEPLVGHAQTPTASDNASQPNPDAGSQSDGLPAPSPANASESLPPHIHVHPLGPAQASRPGEDQFVTLGFNMTFGVGIPGDDNQPGQPAGQGGPTDDFADAFNGLFGQPLPGQAPAANPTAAQGPDNGAQMFGGTVPFAMGRTIEELFTNMSARLAMWPGQAPPPPPQADGQAPPPPQADGQPQAAATEQAAAAAAQATQDQHPLGPFPFPFQLAPLQPHVVNGAPHPAVPGDTETDSAAAAGGPQLPHFTQFLHNAGLPPGGPFMMGGAPPIRHSRMPNPRRERKAWTLPSAPGPTLRQRVEKKEREVGLRCDDISCGVGPSDEDPTVEVSEKRITISKGSTEEGSICSHTFHPSCLVTSQRVALKGSEEKVEGEMVDVSCPVCRADGMITKVDWDAGTLV